jgi:hypothetical protein
MGQCFLVQVRLRKSRYGTFSNWILPLTVAAAAREGNTSGMAKPKIKQGMNTHRDTWADRLGIGRSFPEWHIMRYTYVNSIVSHPNQRQFCRAAEAPRTPPPAEHRFLP